MQLYRDRKDAIDSMIRWNAKFPKKFCIIQRTIEGDDFYEVRPRKQPVHKDTEKTND